MLFLLSPAKSLDYDTPLPAGLPHTLPAFVPQAQQLIAVLRDKSPQEIASLMSISDPLAALNVARYAAWRPRFTADNARQAVMAFNGDVYEGLQAPTLSPDELNWAQQHLAILSGLYGVLRPFDLIRPHRLEMATRLAVGTAKNLYDFWGELVTASLNRDLAREETPVVLNLASDEYARVVQKKRLTAPWLDIQFKEESNGRLRSVAIHAKRARGLMARFILRERITRAADLRAFSDSGYRFRPELSSEWSWVFARPST